MRCHAVQAFQLGLALLVVSAFILFQGIIVVAPDKGSSTTNVSGVQVEISRPSRSLVFAPICQEIQVAVPCLTPSQLMELPNLIKSILYYSRLVTVRLHLVIDAHGQEVLTTLFSTWELPQVHVDYYVVEGSRKGKQFSNLGNDKAGSLLDTLGVVLRKLGTSNQHEKFMVVKPQMVFLDDLMEIWNRFPQILDGKPLTFLESSVREQPRTESNDNNCDPRGVLLVNLANITSMLKPDRDEERCDEESVMILDDPASPTDQKALISTLCSNSSDEFEFTQGSSKNITEVGCIPMSGLYGHTTLSYNYNMETIQLLKMLDGDIFRTMTSPCAKPKQPDFKINPKDKCYDYRYLAHLKRRTHIKYLGSAQGNASEAYEITLVTQLMLNRMSGLERQISLWEGPASVSLYLTDNEVLKFVDYVRQSKILSTRNNIEYHLILARQKPPYPINYLRNVAIKQVKTPYFMMLDVDFAPNPGLQEQVKNIVSKLSPKKKRALVLPCFETKDINYKLPAHNKTQFLSDLSSGKTEAYHQKKGQWSAGHSFTDYKKWKTAVYPYRVRGKFGYEPYLILPISAPQYHEQLLERMRDKLTYTIEVEKAGFELFVLPNSFTVHYPHEPSTIYSVSGTKGFQTCTYKIYNELIKDIKKKYKR